MKEVYIVHSPNCEKCKTMILNIEAIIQQNKIDCKLFKLDYTMSQYSKKAISLAIENNIEQIPFCVIDCNGKVKCFVFDNFTQSEFLKAITTEEKNDRTRK